MTPVLTVLTCLDSADTALARKVDLDIRFHLAAALGHIAVEAIDTDVYVTATATRSTPATS